VPADAPAGLCPQCLLAAGLAESSSQAGLAESSFKAKAAPGEQPPGSEKEPVTTDWPAGAEEPPRRPADISEPPGSVIAGRYQLLEPIGHGGMGVVWRARDVRLNRDVAVKFIQADRLANPAAVHRFTSEAQVTAQLQHPGGA